MSPIFPIFLSPRLLFWRARSDRNDNVGSLVHQPHPEALCPTQRASKDGLGGTDEATIWTILRDPMLRIAPQDEVRGFGAIPTKRLGF